MALQQEIQNEIDQLRSLQTLAQAYEEIASTRMKNIRGRVLNRRDFLDSITKVFDEVRKAYARQVIEIASKKGERAGRITFLSHNGKTVSVMLSANTGLYGGIVHETFRKFISDVRKYDTEVTMIGRYGLSLFLQEEPNRPYSYFDLPDQSVGSDDLKDIIKHIVQYETINVYHGKFVNVVKQIPNLFAISAEIELPDEKQEAPTFFIFEPTLEKILMFFESEIFASLFEQSVGESELAKSASRVMAMDKAAANINKYLDELKMEKLKISHRMSNRRQLNSLSGVFFRGGII